MRFMFEGMRASFIARGADAATATQRAYAALFGLVQKQAAMMAFIDGFMVLAVVFLLMTPLVFLMKKPRHHEGPAVIVGE